MRPSRSSIRYLASERRKLLALIPLTGNGYDWVATKDQTKLFVSIPDQGKIAVVDTANWEVLKYLDAGIKPDARRFAAGW